MSNWIPRPVREGELANYLGEDTLQAIYRASQGTRVPIAIGGTPYYAVDGLIIPRPSNIQQASSLSVLRGIHEKAIDPMFWHRGRPTIRRTVGAEAGGFSSLSDLISEATIGGKRQERMFAKVGPTKTVGRGAELFFRGTFPVPTTEGTGEGGATGTGRILGRTSVGALQQADPAGGDTLHIVTVVANGNYGTNLLLVYDRLWDMNHVLTVDPRSCDAANVPTRYQDATAAGNFISGDVSVVLPAASNTATFDYVDQGGVNTTSPAVNLLTGAVVGTIVLTTPNWFVPLDPADTGVRALQNSANAINLSAAYASGEVCWFIGHPLMYIPIPVANLPVIIDGINSAFNLVQVLVNACMTLLELPTGTVTATTYWGSLTLVSG
jgi:hypothetical protein